MKDAIDALLAAAPTGPARLHILKKPGATSSSLESALTTYKESLEASQRDRLEIIVQSYDLGPQ
jgi:hypothetical protein